jgi:hypothetical protein
MEIALVISSLAGAATAATINRFPKNKNKMPLLGANSQIRAQIDALKIEKEILAKTISRLYQGTDLPQVKRDKLLSRYQHQLGVILSKIEKLEESSKYPDLGPLGDGLMSLMDQKLSALDKRLVEISSKLTIVQPQTEKTVPKKEERTDAKIEKRVQEKPEIATQSIDEMIKSFAKPATRLEITTLTAIPAKPAFEIPNTINPVQQEVQPIVQPHKEILQHTVESVQSKIVQTIQHPIDVEKQVKSEPPKLEFKEESRPEPERRKPKINIPEPEPEDDEDDLDSIKREIMKTLSKLEQAEVE